MFSQKLKLLERKKMHPEDMTLSNADTLLNYFLLPLFSLRKNI